ncbi:MAG: hypothetical protein ACI3ZD_13865, partial [Prevotella sp.]
MKIIRNQITYIIIASAIFMVACGDNERKYARSKEQAERLSLLNDSIGYANSKFLKACDSMLAIAQDSLDYYELLLAKGGVYTVINPADSMLYYANLTLAFTDRCKI